VIWQGTVDPWDLENYDYVRKKIDDVNGQEVVEPAYGGANSLTPSPTYGYGMGVGGGGGAGVGVGMSATMPRPHTQSRRVSRAQCQLECCVPQRTRRRSRSARKEACQSLKLHSVGLVCIFNIWIYAIKSVQTLKDSQIRDFICVP